MITYVLSVGVILSVGCGLDGQDIIRIQNLYFHGYTSLEDCRNAGQKTKRGFGCKRETT